jgi:hypothetical protein
MILKVLPIGTPAPLQIQETPEKIHEYLLSLGFSEASGLDSQNPIRSPNAAEGTVSEIR